MLSLSFYFGLIFETPPSIFTLPQSSSSTPRCQLLPRPTCSEKEVEITFQTPRIFVDRKEAEGGPYNTKEGPLVSNFQSRLCRREDLGKRSPQRP